MVLLFLKKKEQVEERWERHTGHMWTLSFPWQNQEDRKGAEMTLMLR